MSNDGRTCKEGFAGGFVIGAGMHEPEHDHCINCESEIPRNAKFCPRCGARQPPLDEDKKLAKLIDEYYW